MIQAARTAWITGVCWDFACGQMDGPRVDRSAPRVPSCDTKNIKKLTLFAETVKMMSLVCQKR